MARTAAPEVTRGERYSASADVYQLALVCYELATRALPFGALDSAAAVVAAARGERPSLPTTLPAVWTQLLAVAWHAAPSTRPSGVCVVSAVIFVFVTFGSYSPRTGRSR